MRSVSRVLANTRVQRVAGLLIVAALALGASQLPLSAAEDTNPLNHAKMLSKAFRKASEATLPTVVKIETLSKPRVIDSRFRGDMSNPFKGTPLERFFEDEGVFRQPFEMPHRSGLGSGVVIDPRGVILTNNHVVQGADKVKVTLSDGREFESVEVKTDRDTDLAVVRIDGAGSLPSAKLGDSDALEIGDWVIAVGNPFGLEQSVSAGIISAKGRDLAEARRARFLQTDAAINPGNSGGPLVNLEGEVVGINTAIASQSGAFNGVGFAVPSNLARWVVDQLVENGKVQRGYLGVAIRPVTAELAKAFDVAQRDGALVTEVWPDTPAAEAGFQAGDLIVDFAGKKINGPADLVEQVERAPTGKAQSVKVLRSDAKQPVTLSVVVKPMPEDFQIAAAQPGDDEGSDRPAEAGSYRAKELGFTARNLTPDEAKSLGYEKFKGVLVTEVDPEGIAFASRLRPGMLVMAVGRGRAPVTNTGELSAALAKESLDDGVLLLVRFPQGGQDFLLLKK